MMSPMGKVLRTLGGGHVFVMLREEEVGYTMVRDPGDVSGATILGPAIGNQKITLDALSYREVVKGDELNEDVWEFTMTSIEQTPGGPVPSRSSIYICGKDILTVRVPSALVG